MSEPRTLPSFEIDFVVERARELWRDASARTARSQVELYAKVAQRIRVNRGPSRGRHDYSRSVETGVAVRTLNSRVESAGFAASSGLSRDAVRWVLERAVSRDRLVSGESPDTAGIVRQDSYDLDAVQALPTESGLLEEVEADPSVEWIEAGITSEVLLGATGRLTARRRHRVWGLVQTDSTRVIARRSLMEWRDARLRSEVESANTSARSLPVNQSVTFLPDAAAPIVLALVGWAHLRAPSIGLEGGNGWSVDDDPRHLEGLSGGIFDDAGFLAESRALAREGTRIGQISGSGTMWRRSFRDPPEPAPSNLTMPPGLGYQDRPQGEVVDRCRVIRLNADLWVLELEFVPGGRFSRRRAYPRVSPAELLGRCSSRIGMPQVTPDGPIVPSLVFEPWPLEFST